jgi:hypothetical protein
VNNTYGESNVPAPPPGLSYVQVTAGDYHTVALLSDGSVVAWGANYYGQSTVPPLPSGLSYVEVAACSDHTVARCSDGSVVAWGDNSAGQCNVPALPPGVTYFEVAAGGFHTVARRSDGTVVAWGSNGYGQCSVAMLPPGLSYVEVAAGYDHTVARRSDGSVVAWGINFACNVPVLPPGLTFASLAAGRYRTVAVLRAGAYATFGSGCPGSAGVTHVDAITLPRLGQTMTVRIEPLPLSVALLIAGLSNVSGAAGALPMDLSQFGLTNCLLRVSPDASILLIGTGLSASFALAVPATPSLAGLILHQQAVVLDPAAGNPAGLVMSDAATAVVGL